MANHYNFIYLKGSLIFQIEFYSELDNKLAKLYGFGTKTSTKQFWKKIKSDIIILTEKSKNNKGVALEKQTNKKFKVIQGRKGGNIFQISHVTVD